MTSNEIRQIIGMKPSDDPKADELRNSNLNHPDEQTPPGTSLPPNEETPVEETGATDEVSTEEPPAFGDLPLSALTKMSD